MTLHLIGNIWFDIAVMITVMITKHTLAHFGAYSRQQEARRILCLLQICLDSDLLSCISFDVPEVGDSR